ncbi:hypothetical protein [Kaistella carnis]|uniref:Uncharacterized protein n=1 Tax=Kaistella carnis TaxID=1241979 RepID=A0A3G8Y194_9FLAO|nr:hypothetical protein [Kaistella carnis]AZI34326.1 hypothetical protein EIB73_14575 [Kaistella carnis]
MNDGLNIKVIENNETKSSFDKSFGLLKLIEAGEFKVEVTEFANKRKQIDADFAKGEQFAREKWNERATQPEWTKVKLDENWNANKAQREAKRRKSVDDLEIDYKEVNWVWVVAPKQLQPNELSHNDSFTKGITGSGVYSLRFPKILEGGGLAYMEAFQPKEGAKGKKPNGVFVQAMGKPKIIRVEWTDFDYNLLKDRLVAFNSEVLLHIYTEGLYGQELEIQLFDEDIFTADDQLNVSEKSSFQREVNIHIVHPKEVGKPGISDALVKGGQDNTDQKAEQENYLQKTTIEVKVDWGWMKFAGENIKIYPTVKSRKTGEYFKNFSREHLEVGMNGVLHSAPQEVTNLPVVQSEISTNIAAYHPCQYTQLDYTDPKGLTNTLFKEKSAEELNPKLEIGIIVGSDPKKFSLKVDDKADTTDCRFDKTPKDHDKNIFTYDKAKLPKNINITEQQPKNIAGTAFFDYERMNMMKYFWLSNDFQNNQKYSHLKIIAATCRHQNNINFSILPDIEWEVAFIITTMAGFRVKAENTTVTRLQQGLGEYQFKGIKAEQTGKLIQKGGVGYSLNIKYSINGGDFYEQISLNFVRNIEKIIGTYNSIVGFASLFKGDENNKTSAAISKSVINKITFDIEPPSIVFLLKWKYDFAKSNGQPVANFTGAAGFKPLIGLKIGFDITQNLSVFGFVGTAIEWLLDIIENLIKEDIYILAEAGTAISYDIGLSYNEIDGFAPNTKQKVVVDLTFTFKVGIKKKDVIMIPDVRRMEGNTIPTDVAERENFKIEGSVATGIRYIEEHGIEKGKGKYKKTETSWLGAEMTIIVVTLAHNRKQNAPPNNEYKDKFIILKPRKITQPETVYENK